MSAEMTDQGPAKGDDRARGRSSAAPGNRKVVMSAVGLGLFALLIYAAYITAVVLRTG